MGAILAVALVVAIAILVCRRTRNRRQGWRKEELDGGAAPSGRRSRGRRGFGGGWGSRLAAKDHGNDAFGVMPGGGAGGANGQSAS